LAVAFVFASEKLFVTMMMLVMVMMGT